MDAIHGKLGIMSNTMRTMATSPVVLEGYLGLSGTLAGRRLPRSTARRSPSPSPR
jgi:hypothetical protein